MDHSRSTSIYNQAQQYMPAGVNSPVRAFRAVGGQPVVFESAYGAYLTDVDGNTYIDYVGSWGPMILGHSHPKVVEAVTQMAQRAMSFGAPHEGELKLAQKVTELMPHIEMLRFVNSGTEATMSAVRLARGATNRPSSSSSMAATMVMSTAYSPKQEAVWPRSVCLNVLAFHLR